MKRILLSGVALLAFSAFYGQQTEWQQERLTTNFEKKWSTAIALTSSGVLEATEGKANNYENQMATYAPIFLDIPLNGQTPRKALPRLFEMHVFILKHKNK